MANSMAAGEIYIVEELHPRTGEPTDYCKIGIVKESEHRSSESRVKEHQTGNPRLLRLSEVIKSEIVKTVETTLHGIYATQRLSGEWFFLTGEQRVEVVSMALRLSAEAQQAAKDMRLASDLRTSLSEGGAIPASDEALAAFQSFGTFRSRLKAVSIVQKKASGILRSLIEADGGENRFGSLSRRSDTLLFDEEAFKAAHPELHARLVIMETKPTGPFRPARHPEAVPFADIEQLSADLDSAIAESGDNLAGAVHHAYLRDFRLRRSATGPSRHSRHGWRSSAEPHRASPVFARGTAWRRSLRDSTRRH